MTAERAVAALRRAAVPAFGVALVILVGVVGVLEMRGERYRSQAALVATPAVDTAGGGPSLGEVVALVLPVVPQLVVSPSARSSVREAVGTADVDEESTTVEVVPNSAVVRITVTAPSARTAAAVLREHVARVQSSDILSPAGQFTVVADLNSPARRVGPDRWLEFGLGGAAAVLAGLLTVAAVNARRPRLLTVGDVAEVARALDVSVPVEYVRGRGGADLIAWQIRRRCPDASSACVAQVGGVAPDVLLAALADLLPGAVLPLDGRSPAGRAGAAGDADVVVVVSVRLRRCTREQLSVAMLSAVVGRIPLVAVAVT